MQFFPDASTFLNVGPISIKWYAVLILSGAMCVYFIAVRNLRKIGYKSDLVDDLFFGALLAGIVGARLWYVAFYDLSSYLANPISILMTWQGGLAIQGGLVLGAAYGYWFTRKRKVDFKIGRAHV